MPESNYRKNDYIFLSKRFPHRKVWTIIYLLLILFASILGTIQFGWYGGVPGFLLIYITGFSIGSKYVNPTNKYTWSDADAYYAFCTILWPIMVPIIGFIKFAKYLGSNIDPEIPNP